MKQSTKNGMWRDDTFDNDADEVINDDTSSKVVYDQDRLTC